MAGREQPFSNVKIEPDLRSSTSTHPYGQNHGHQNESQWDLLKNLERTYDSYEPQNAKEEHLVRAQGDLPENKVSEDFSLTPLFVFAMNERGSILSVVWIFATPLVMGRGLVVR